MVKGMSTRIDPINCGRMNWSWRVRLVKKLIIVRICIIRGSAILTI